MQELISKKDNHEYPLQCINVKEFIKMSETDRNAQLKLRVKELEGVLEKNNQAGLKIEVGKQTPERSVRYLNRMIKTIRGELTATDIVVEMYQTVIDLGEEDRHVHKLIFKALDEQVPISSIRRILSQYRNGKLG